MGLTGENRGYENVPADDHHEGPHVSVRTSVDDSELPQSVDVVEVTINDDPYVSVAQAGSNNYEDFSEPPATDFPEAFPVARYVWQSFPEDCIQPLLVRHFHTPPASSRNGGDASSSATLLGYLKTMFCTMLFGCKLNILLLFLPVAFCTDAQGMSRGWVFVFSLLTLAPLAERLGFITEQIALSTNPMIGGLLNATFSNAPELILSIVALKAGLFRVVQLSLLGSVLGNMLLCLGSAFFAGGIVHKEQKFNGTACMTNTGLLMLGAMSLLFPHLLHSTHTETEMDISELHLSRVCALVMLIAYVSYIVFQFITHVDLYNDDNNEEEAIIGLWSSLPWLALITACISIMSNVLVDTMASAAKEWGVPVAFICVILLPVFNNVAEHGSAVLFGLKDKLDLSLGIAVGSSIQISMFLMPLCVLAGWICGKPMDLNFHKFESVTNFVVILVSAIILNDGKSNWLKGLVLILGYIIVATAFFFHTDKYLMLKQLPEGIIGQFRLGL